MAASVVLGAVFGAAAACWAGMFDSMPLIAIGAFVGAIVGLMSSALLVYALSYGPWLSGLLKIGVPTTFVAFLSGGVYPDNAGPLISLPITLLVYTIACCWRGRLGRRRYAPLLDRLCRLCDYDRSGLPPGAVCPECGTPGEKPMASSSEAIDAAR